MSLILPKVFMDWDFQRKIKAIKLLLSPPNTTKQRFLGMMIISYRWP